MKGLTIKAKDHKMDLLEAHIDPTHGDIVIVGYGITRKSAKKLRDWLTKAIRKTKEEK